MTRNYNVKNEHTKIKHSCVRKGISKNEAEQGIKQLPNCKNCKYDGGNGGMMGCYTCDENLSSWSPIDHT